MKVQRPVLGKITQGTIFNCATADRYRGKLVHGLTITARCDIANDKYPVLNYLPVVTLLDWMHCDGLEIILANALKSELGKFKGILKQFNVASSVLDSVSKETVVESFFENDAAPKAAKKKAAEARKVATVLSSLEGFDFHDAGSRNWLLEHYSKEVSALIKDLINNKVPSFYYIPSATEDNEKTGFVILLRESAFLPRTIAEEVAKGVERPITGKSELTPHLSFAHDDFAMPVGLIPSPNIEHILQTFSFMFGRIGLDDYNPEFIDEVCNQKFTKEEAPAQ